MIGAMQRVEIWKSRALWRTLSSKERQTLVYRLTSLVRPNPRDVARKDWGPYLIRKSENDLLIWTIETEELKVEAPYGKIGLDEYFEPLLYMAATEKFNAKTLAGKLSV